MSYMDIWMYNSRPRIRVFLCYLLIFVLFFIFSDIMIYFYTKSLYQPLEGYEIETGSPKITLTLAEATNVNGNLGGTIKNDTKEAIENKYIKFEFYTARDVKVGTKYIKIDSLNSGEEKPYEFGFRFERVKKVKISAIDDPQIEQASSDEFKLEGKFGPAGLISGLILAHFFL